jgi:hypothetical protein
VDFTDPQAPHHRRTGRLRRTGDELVLEGPVWVRLSSVPAPREVLREPVRERRTPKYLLRLEDGRFLYVSATGWMPELALSYRVYVGYGPKLDPIPMTRAQRASDGTTVIVTSLGQLYLPSRARLAARERPKFGGRTVESLNPGEFEIREFGGEVTITPR